MLFLSFGQLLSYLSEIEIEIEIDVSEIEIDMR